MHRAAVDADCPFASGLQRSGSRLRPRENPRPPPSCPGWNEKGGQRIYEPLVRQDHGGPPTSKPETGRPMSACGGYFVLVSEPRNTRNQTKTRSMRKTLQRQAAPPTVKQHMAAIRMLFSWLTEKGVLAMNRARELKTERFSRTEGKTPAFVEGEVQKLLNVIETSTHTSLRDRALLGVLAYTFARIGAVVNLSLFASLIPGDRYHKFSGK